MFWCALTRFCDVVQTENHVLRRHCDRSTVSWVQDVMWSQHQDLSFKNCSVTEWQVNSHLVTVEVSVESCTYERVQSDSLTFNEFRLESLDTETVQCRSTVQQYWVSFQYVFENIPNDRVFTVNDFLCWFDSLHNTAFYHLTDDKWFVEFCRHIFWKTAFVHIKFRTDNDNRTTWVVNTFTEQVLTETTLFTFQAIAQRFKRTIGISLNSAWFTWVI